MSNRSYLIGILISTKKSEKLSKTVELLEESIIKIGHRVFLIYPPEIDILVKGRKTELLNLADKPDVIINRHDTTTVTSHDIQVTKQLEDMGIPFVNPIGKSIVVHNKFLVNKILMSAGIPFPAMARLGCNPNLDEIVKNLGDFPLVLKANQSNQGKGVVLIPNIKTLRSVYDFIKNGALPEDFFLQSYVPEASKLCIRSIIIGNEIIATYGTRAQKNDFRAGLRKGDFVGDITTSRDEEKILLKIPKILELDVVGVDYARTKTGLKIIEVNSYPGFGGFFKVSGINLTPYFVKMALQKINS